MDSDTHFDANLLEWWKPSPTDDPYAIYERLCALDPFYHDTRQGFWFLNRHADILAVLRDERFCQIATADDAGGAASERAPRVPPNLPHPKLFPLVQRGKYLSTLWLAAKDPPDHSRLRAWLNPGFTSANLEAWRPRIDAITNQLIDRAQAAGKMDILADLGFPLPLMVISEMLGIPPEDRAQLKGWASDAEAGFDLLTRPFSRMRGALAVAALGQYFQKLIAEHRKRAKDDLLDALLEVQGEYVSSEDELISNTLLLFVAGNETVVYWIANAMLALLRHPDQLRMLQNDASLIPTAMEEILRFDSPVLFDWRAAAQELEFRGHTIQKGERLVLLLGAAHRDPERFTDPHRLDITRTPNPHLSFASGIHYCLGAPLARLQTQIAVSTLLRRLPTLTLGDQPLEWEPNFRLRRLKSLQVRF